VGNNIVPAIFFKTLVRVIVVYNMVKLLIGSSSNGFSILDYDIMALMILAFKNQPSTFLKLFGSSCYWLDVLVFLTVMCVNNNLSLSFV
jgi:hypothetical protein